METYNSAGRDAVGTGGTTSKLDIFLSPTMNINDWHYLTERGYMLSVFVVEPPVMVCLIPAGKILASSSEKVVRALEQLMVPVLCFVGLCGIRKCEQGYLWISWISIFVCALNRIYFHSHSCKPQIFLDSFQPPWLTTLLEPAPLSEAKLFHNHS